MVKMCFVDDTGAEISVSEQDARIELCITGELVLLSKGDAKKLAEWINYSVEEIEEKERKSKSIWKRFLLA